MNEFKTFHPIVNFIFFLAVIGFAMFFMHPVCLIISFASGFLYSVIIKGKNAIKTNIVYMLLMIIITALINPAFNHEGVTILGYLPSGNPLTLESIIYGISAALMIISVICWFSCYNEIMTSDKFIYLFGKIIPSLSLIMSMTLRFVPKFAAQLKVVVNAQKCIGRDISNGSVLRRAKNGLAILSIMTTWALENSIDTADSMKSRGYGLPGRTAFSIFTFDKRDKIALFYIISLSIYVLIGYFTGAIYFAYFPFIERALLTIYSFSVYLAYLGLCITPVIIEILEARRWKVIKSKI